MGRMADDFYLIAHSDRSGRCRLTQRAVGLGLAAGLLAELVLAGQVRVPAGRLVPGAAERPPLDRAVRDLADGVATAPGADLSAWLSRVSPEAAERARYRLVLDGVLTRVTSRAVLGRRRVVWVPVDPNQALWPSVRLAKHLSGGLELTIEDQVLTALVDVTGLLDTVLWCKPDHLPGFPRAAAVRRELPGDLSALIAYTDAAVGHGVLAGRGT